MKRFLCLVTALFLLLTGCSTGNTPADLPDSTPADTPDSVTEPVSADTAETEDISVPDTTEPSETSKAPETSKTPETTAAPETTKTPETTAAPETTKTPETTAAPEPEKPKTPSYFDPTGLKSVTLPQHYNSRTVLPTSVTPEIDGVLTEEEWGEPDLRLNADITGGTRTYCRDYFAGAGKNIADTEYHWRYDESYVYVAMRIREPADYAANLEGLVAEYAAPRLNIVFGGEDITAVFHDGRLVSLYGSVCAAVTEKDGVYSCEFAIPRENVLSANYKNFLGFADYEVYVRYYNIAKNENGGATVRTRTTPMFQNDQFTHDVFTLAAGTPAPAPELEIHKPLSATGEIELETEDYILQFSAPTLLDQGPVGDQAWGHYQFPSLTRYSDGTIRAAWSYGQDVILPTPETNPNGANHSVSKDNGKTWTFAGSVSGASTKNLMKNGKYFTGFAGKGAYATDYLDKYEPAFSWGNGDYKIFFADDIKETQDKTVKGYEYDPVTGKTTSFNITVNWPYMPLVQFPGKAVYPLAGVFSLNNRAVFAVDGDLYLPLYFHGLDSFADSREDAVSPLCRRYSIYFFRSSDNGRTWDLISQIMTDEKIKGATEGVCESEMTVLPDGSFIILMRTGSNNPSYIARSTDRGLTWSDPQLFDYIGVLPQLLTLECGVTLASYGRPTMRFAATDDPDGAAWAQFDFPVTGGAGQSCFYTDLMALSENTALFIYTDFQYPNPVGEPAKAILVRTVTVIPK